jgi:hypothetical protein
MSHRTCAEKSLSGWPTVRTVTADQALDVQLLQTAASVENALVAAYDVLLALPSLAGASANPVLKTFLTQSRLQHVDHATACNDLAGRLGGRPQSGANAAVSQLLTRARNGLTDVAPIVDLALQVEVVAAQTYQNDVALFADVNARRLAAMIMSVESQHVGTLQLVKALLAARALDLVVLDNQTATRLPAEAVKAGFPEAFSKTDEARPPAEGAVR